MGDETCGDTVRPYMRSSTAWRPAGQAGSGFSSSEHAPSVASGAVPNSTVDAGRRSQPGGGELDIAARTGLWCPVRNHRAQTGHRRAALDRWGVPDRRGQGPDRRLVSDFRGQRSRTFARLTGLPPRRTRRNQCGNAAASSRMPSPRGPVGASEAGAIAGGIRAAMASNSSPA